jgi:hypothetical protein
MIGEVFFWRINRVLNQTRGHSTLLQLLDWMDATDQFLFDALEGFRLRNAFFVWLKLTGLSPKEIEQKQNEITTPATGTTRVTNEKAEWKVVTPDLKSVDVDTAFKMLQQFIVGAKGFPAHWFGSGEDANLATGKVMAIPTMRMLKAAQKTCRDIVKMMVRFVTDQAIIGKTLKLDKGEFVKTEVTMFDFERDNAASIASAFTQIVTALALGTENGWISDDTAKKVVDGIVTRFGVEVSVEETVEKNLLERDQKTGEETIDDATDGKVPAEVIADFEKS